MTYGTRGTLRKTKSAEDYKVEDGDIIKAIAYGALIAVIVSSGIIWSYFG